MKEKWYKWAKTCKDWIKEQLRNAVFSNESHFFIQGQRSQHVRRSSEEKICDSHINQLVKHPEKKMFWGCFSYYGVQSRQPFEGMLRLSRSSKKSCSGAGKEVSWWLRDLSAGSCPCHTSKWWKISLQRRICRYLIGQGSYDPIVHQFQMMLFNRNVWHSNSLLNFFESNDKIVCSFLWLLSGDQQLILVESMTRSLVLRIDC